MGNVVLIAGGGRTYTDIAARFVKSERSVSEIIRSNQSPEIIERILSSGHLAATEFDYFIFGVEGYSRVTEAQLIRKRMASYLIKSGRVELGGKRKFEVSLPKSVESFPAVKSFLELSENLYNEMLEAGIPEEDARYIKPQATTFRGIVGMNAHALWDFFGQRCCRNAQWEIRDMANKMLFLCKEASPELFKGAGPKCLKYGFCPEGEFRNRECKVPTVKELKELWKLKTV